MSGPAPAPAAAIELRGLRRDYEERRALDDVSLSVAPGEIFGYVGPNGAGKTTTLKILTGLLRPTAGDALVGGISVLERPLEVKARIGYVPESGALYEKLSAGEYLSLIGRLHQIPEAELQERVGRWLEWFGLTARRDEPIGGLSKGLKQKVCWCAALIHDPEVLVLDEPLSGLDVESVARVKGLLGELSRSGRTVFYSSHLIDVVERVCTRLAVIHAGRLRFLGRAEELVARSGGASLEQALLALGGRTLPDGSGSRVRSMPAAPDRAREARRSSGDRKDAQRTPMDDSANEPSLPPMRAKDYSEAEDWPGYFGAVLGLSPRDTLIAALDAFAQEGVETGFAVDIAAGEGRDSLELLRRGWRVLATDSHPEAFIHLWPRVPEESKSRLTALEVDFERMEIPPCDLANASFALPFCPPRHFAALWSRIVAAIRPGGRFAGQFFGDRDSWASLPNRTHHSRDEVIGLLAGFEIEMMREEDRDDPPDVRNPKHWQLFHVVARKSG